MKETIDANKLKILADRIWTLFDEFGIDAEMFTVGVRVPPEFYRSIKVYFPDRHEIDMVVGSGEENWHISLMCSPFETSKDNE